MRTVRCVALTCAYVCKTNDESALRTFSDERKRTCDKMRILYKSTHTRQHIHIHTYKHIHTHTHLTHVNTRTHTSVTLEPYYFSRCFHCNNNIVVIRVTVYTAVLHNAFIVNQSTRARDRLFVIISFRGVLV